MLLIWYNKYMEIRRHHLIIAAIVLAGIVVMMQPSILSSLFIIIFMGIIPGTSIVIPAWLTLLGFIVLAVLAVRWLLDSPTYRPVPTSRDRTRRQAARRRVIRRASTQSHPVRKYLKRVVKA